MQPSELQVERSIVALGQDRKRPRHDAGTSPDRVDLLTSLLEQIGASPRVRQDRVDAARARLAGGQEPTADDVATMLVGRMVCDRLR